MHLHLFTGLVVLLSVVETKCQVCMSIQTCLIHSIWSPFSRLCVSQATLAVSLETDNCSLLQTKMEAARAKAEAISGQEDLPMGSKMKEIQKLMAKARASGKGKGKKKATRSDQYKKTKPLDRRMMSDKRAINHKAKKKAAKKSKPKGKKNNGGKSR